MYMTQPDANGKKRRIDYVLVYEEEAPGVVDDRRKHFEQNLEVADLELETEDKAVYSVCVFIDLRYTVLVFS